MSTNIHQRNKQSTGVAKKSSSASPFWGLLLILIFLFAWPVLDASNGPPQPIDGLVTGKQWVGKGRGFIYVIGFSDGSVIRVPSDVAFFGGGPHTVHSVFTAPDSLVSLRMPITPPIVLKALH